MDCKCNVLRDMKKNLRQIQLFLAINLISEIYGDIVPIGCFEGSLSNRTVLRVGMTKSDIYRNSYRASFNFESCMSSCEYSRFIGVGFKAGDVALGPKDCNDIGCSPTRERYIICSCGEEFPQSKHTTYCPDLRQGSDEWYMFVGESEKPRTLVYQATTCVTIDPEYNETEEIFSVSLNKSVQFPDHWYGVFHIGLCIASCSEASFKGSAGIAYSPDGHRFKCVCYHFNTTFTASTSCPYFNSRQTVWYVDLANNQESRILLLDIPSEGFDTLTLKTTDGKNMEPTLAIALGIIVPILIVSLGMMFFILYKRRFSTNGTSGVIPDGHVEQSASDRTLSLDQSACATLGHDKPHISNNSPRSSFGPIETDAIGGEEQMRIVNKRQTSHDNKGYSQPISLPNTGDDGYTRYYKNLSHQHSTHGFEHIYAEIVE